MKTFVVERGKASHITEKREGGTVNWERRATAQKELVEGLEKEEAVAKLLVEYPDIGRARVASLVGVDTGYVRKFEVFHKDTYRAIIGKRDSVPQNIREDVKKRDDYKCVKCTGRRNLVVHHIIPNRAGGSSLRTGNLATLCESCHTTLHDSGVFPDEYDTIPEFWDWVRA